MGGRGAGRSTVASQYATARLRDTTSYFRCAIMRFVLGDIRNSIFQDINDRIEEQELDSIITTKEHILTFSYGQNTINGIGFRKSSGDQKAKLKSLANYNCVIIEEADEVSEEDFMQLDDSIRTVKSDIKVILLLNPPPKDHWIIKRWFNLIETDVDGFYVPQLKESEKDNTLFVHTTYQDNIQNIADVSVANYERYKERKPEHYHNMIQGLVSEGLRGRIYKTWRPMKTSEFDAIPYPSIYGLDFGFTNHPTALVEVKMHNENIWLRELLYEKGLTNKLICKRMETLEVPRDKIIYADSAEPKSIREINEENWMILPAEKGPDSINAGIDMMLDMNVVYTEDSENLKTEIENYTWKLDKNKEPTNDPIDGFDHLMDAARYALFTHKRQPFIGFA